MFNLNRLIIFSTQLDVKWHQKYFLLRVDFHKRVLGEGGGAKAFRITLGLGRGCISGKVTWMRLRSKTGQYNSSVMEEEIKKGRGKGMKTNQS